MSGVLPPARRAWVLIGLRLLGFSTLILAIIGAVLPLLPTTPFLLVSAGCFARCSPRWHQRLLDNPTFGPLLENWESARCVNCKTKCVALLSMLLVGGSSVFLSVQNPQARMVAIALITLGAVIVLRLKTCKKASPEKL